ncbi:hypothetical protein CRG98_028591 [Punica granatum]|uniref:Uncharacterized protein n=1 Tax=Punica granatum TaxID=22663 RepID=A0A2I0J465_PUNGR|nr:hypothetical protein CRG98_028591 [Punica granatum]
MSACSAGLQYARAHCPMDCGVLEHLLGGFYKMHGCLPDELHDALLNEKTGRVARVYGPECGLLSGPASRGLGVSTFPWGRVTDTCEKESPLIILRPEGRGRISYPGSKGIEHLVC